MSEKQIQHEILLVMFRRGRPMTIAEIVEATGRAETTVRNNLHVLLHAGRRQDEPYVEQVSGSVPQRWALTDSGRDPDRWRSRRRL